MKIKSILSAILLMASTIASAQYLNIQMEDGTIRSFRNTSNMKVSFGDKKGLEPTEVLQTLFFNGYTVTVKLAENTPSSVVALSAYVDDDFVKIKAWSAMNVALKCTRDDGVAVSAPETSGDFQIFTISDITKDVVVTVEYASWDEDNIINGHPCVRLAGLYWATENVEGSGSGYSPKYQNQDYGHYYSYEEAQIAAQSWGGENGHSWTLPSRTQWQKLIDNCTLTWYHSYHYKDKDLPGLLIEGKKENNEEGHRLFLPAAGFYMPQNTALYFNGDRIMYLAITGSLECRFTDKVECWFDSKDYNYRPVRPVSE